MPQAVRNELRMDEALPGTDALRVAISEGWSRVQDPQDRALVTMLQTRLDAGESEAIALALEVKADYLLLDEREGRQAAGALDLRVTGVLGILLHAKQTGRLLSLTSTIQQLQQQAGFHLTQKLTENLLREVDE